MLNLKERRRIARQIAEEMTGCFVGDRFEIHDDIVTVHQAGYTITTIDCSAGLRVTRRMADGVQWDSSLIHNAGSTFQSALETVMERELGLTADVPYPPISRR